MTNTHLKPSACCDCNVDRSNGPFSFLTLTFFLFSYNQSLKLPSEFHLRSPSYRIPSVFSLRASSPAVKARALSSQQPIAVNHTKWDPLLSERSRLTSQSTQGELLHWTESHAHPNQFSLQICCSFYLHIKQCYIYYYYNILYMAFVNSGHTFSVFFSLFVQLQLIVLTNLNWNSYQSHCLPLNAWWTFGWSEQFSWLILHQEHEEEFND